MPNQPLIQVNNVSFIYNHELVLDDVSFKVNKGTYLGLIGPNGSGKTTLLKIILGLLKPKTGSIQLFDQDIHNFTDWSKIGYVPQRASMANVTFPLTAEEVVSLGLLNNSRWIDFMSSQDKKAITQALDAVDMVPHRHSLITELSGGQQQRVFIARALVSNPDLLILDEPTVGVDSDSQAKFYELLRDFNRKLQLTLVLISHDIEVVAQEASEIACLNCKLIAHGKPKDMLHSDVMKKLYGEHRRFVAHEH
jgi:zinc transport system ATP-binding protein